MRKWDDSIFRRSTVLVSNDETYMETALVWTVATGVDLPTPSCL